MDREGNTVTREEFEAFAQHCLQSLKFKDPILTTFRVACSYGPALANGKLSARQFIRMFINAKVCLPKKDSEDAKSILNILAKSYVVEDPLQPDLREAVVRNGQELPEHPSPDVVPVVDAGSESKSSPKATPEIDKERVAALNRRINNDKMFDEAERAALYQPVWRHTHQQFDELETVTLGKGRGAREMENSVSLAKVIQIADFEITDEKQIRSLLRSGKKYLLEADVHEIFLSVVPEGHDATITQFAVLLIMVAQKMFPEEFNMNHQSAIVLFMGMHIVPYVRDVTPKTLAEVMRLRPLARVPDVATIIKQYDAVLHAMFARFASLDVGGKDGMTFDSFVDIVRAVGIAGGRLPHERLYEIAKLYEDTHGPRYASLGIVLAEDQFVEAVILVGFAMFNNELDKDKLPTLASRLLCHLEMWLSYYAELFHRNLTSDLLVLEPPVPIVNRLSPTYGEMTGGYDITIEGSHLDRRAGGYVRFGNYPVVAHTIHDDSMVVHVPEAIESTSFDVIVHLHDGAIHGKVIMKHVVEVRVSNDGETYSPTTIDSVFTYEDHKPEFSLLEIQSKLLRIFSNYCHLDDPKNTKSLGRAQWVRFLKDFNFYEELTKDSSSSRNASREDNSDAILFFNRSSVNGGATVGNVLRYNGFIRAVCLCFVSLGRPPQEVLRELVSTDQWIGRELLHDVEIMQKGEFRDKLKFITNSFTTMQVLDHVPHACTPRNPVAALSQEEEIDECYVGEGILTNLGDLDGMLRNYLSQRQTEDQTTAANSAMYQTWVTGSTVEARHKEAAEKERELRDLAAGVLTPNVDGIDPRDGLLLTRQHIDGLMRGTARDRLNLAMRRLDMETSVANKRIEKLNETVKKKEADIGQLTAHLTGFRDKERKMKLENDVVAHGVLRSEKELWKTAFDHQLETKKLELEAVMLAQESSRDIERDHIVNIYRNELISSETALTDMHKVLEDQSKFLSRQSTVMEVMNIRMRILQSENVHLKASQDDLMTMVQRDKYPERYSDWVQKNVGHKDRVEAMLRKLTTAVNAPIAHGNEGVGELLNLPQPPKSKIASWDKADIAGLVKQPEVVQKTVLIPPESTGRKASFVAPITPLNGHKTQTPQTAFSSVMGESNGDFDGESGVFPREKEEPGISLEDAELIVVNQDDKMMILRADFAERIEALQMRVASLSERVEKVARKQAKAPKEVALPTASKPKSRAPTPEEFKRLQTDLDAKIAAKSKRIDELTQQFVEKEQDYEERILMLNEELKIEREYFVEGQILYCVRPNADTMLDVASTLGCKLEDLMEHCEFMTPAIPKGRKYLKIKPTLVNQIPSVPNELEVSIRRNSSDLTAVAISEYTKVFNAGTIVHYHNILPADTVQSVCAKYAISRDDLLRANFIPLNIENPDQSIHGIASKQLRIPTYTDAQASNGFDPFTRISTGVNTESRSTDDNQPKIRTALLTMYLRRFKKLASELRDQVDELQNETGPHINAILGLMSEAMSTMPTEGKMSTGKGVDSPRGGRGMSPNRAGKPGGKPTKPMSPSRTAMSDRREEMAKSNGQEQADSPREKREGPQDTPFGIQFTPEGPGITPFDPSTGDASLMEARGHNRYNTMPGHALSREQSPYYKPKEFILTESPKRGERPMGLPVVVGRGNYNLVEPPSPLEVVRTMMRHQLQDKERHGRAMIGVDGEGEFDVLVTLEKAHRPINYVYVEGLAPPVATTLKNADLLAAREMVKKVHQEGIDRVKAYNKEKEARLRDQREIKETALAQRHLEATQKRAHLLADKKPSNIIVRNKLMLGSLTRDSDGNLVVEKEGIVEHVPSGSPVALPTVQFDVPPAVAPSPVRRVLPPVTVPANAISASLPPVLQQQLRSLQAVETTLRNLPNSDQRSRVLQQRFGSTVFKYLQKPPDVPFTPEEEIEVAELRHFLSTKYNSDAALMSCLESVASSVPNGWAPTSRMGRAPPVTRPTGGLLPGPTAKASTLQPKPLREPTETRVHVEKNENISPRQKKERKESVFDAAASGRAGSRSGRVSFSD